MKNILKIVSVTGLALNIVPAILVFNNIMSFDNYKWLMLAGTLMWFASAPFWVNKGKENSF